MPPADDPADSASRIRPGGGRGQNPVGGLARGTAAEIFDPAALRHLAEDRCGRAIDLDPLARDGLDHLARDLRQASPGLSYLGRKLLQQGLIDRLVRRAELAEGTGPCPPVSQPVFIVGPFRTGSTFLHRLLALDPQFRCPTATEVSVPPGFPDAGDERPEIRVARYLDHVTRLSPRLFRLHPVGADDPEECFALLESSFLSPSFQFWAPVPGYMRWLLARPEEDWDRAYDVHARLLSGIASRRDRTTSPGPPPRWVLKSPFHLWGLAALMRRHPDALIVQLSRPADQAMPSTAALLEANRQVFARRDRVGTLAAEATEMMRAATSRAQEAHRAAPDRFLHIAFDDLTRAPVPTLRRIHDALGLALDPEVADRMSAAAASIGRTTSRS